MKQRPDWVARRIAGMKSTRASQQKPIAERFYSHVNKTAGCWYWVGAKNIHGYGVFTDRSRKPHTRAAHRVAYELARGPIPSGLLVCHTCDVRDCVRPDHLFAGTYRDNTQDAIAKGRLDPSETFSRLKGLPRKPHSEQTKAKISAGHLRYWARRRAGATNAVR